MSYFDRIDAMAAAKPAQPALEQRVQPMPTPSLAEIDAMQQPKARGWPKGKPRPPKVAKE